jgi:methionine biosynthesis protein MetW
LTSGSKTVDHVSSPDQNAAGFLQSAPDPLRYDGDRPLDPDEVPGIVADMIPTGSRVLDIGCGTGSLSRILSDACHAEIVGIEPDPIRAQRATERGVKVYVGPLTPELICQIGSSDIVLLADVLEHLPNPQAMLVLAREALRPRGAVIVSVPNVAHWSVRADLIHGRFRYQPWGIMDATHLRWFTVETAKSLLASAGFNVVEYRATAGIGLLDNYGRAPLRWLPPTFRNRLLQLGCRHWPTLFGSQHVLKAEML